MFQDCFLYNLLVPLGVKRASMCDWRSGVTLVHVIEKMDMFIVFFCNHPHEDH